MKKLKFIYSLIFIIGLMFATNINVKAFPSSIGPIRQVAELHDNDGKPYFFPLQVTGDGYIVLCTELDVTVAVGQTCTLSDDWDNRTRAGIAAIIDASKSGYSSTGFSNEYFAATLAINRFLGNSKIGDNPNLSSQVEILYNSYLQKANTAYNNYERATSSISASSLTFTKSGSNYVSNTFKITTNGTITSTNVSKGSVNSLGSGNYNVIIPESDLSTGQNIITFTYAVSKSDSMARRYDCNGLQNVTLGRTENVTSSHGGGITGEITIEEKSSISILKVDENGKPLAGATLQLLTSGGTMIKKWETTTEAKVFNDLKPGKYIVIEVGAPEGYIRSDERIEVTLKADETSKVQMKNIKEKEKTIIKVLKVDENGKPIAGAGLQIQDSSGKEVKSWISKTTEEVFTDLAVGTYYLIETSAPEGYEKSDERKQFKVSKDDKTVTLEYSNSKEPKLTIIEALKVDESGKPIAGAQLQIKDSKGKVVKSWTSKTTAEQFTDLVAGTYVLVEVKAPDGYVLSTEEQKFTVAKDNKTIQLEVKNKANKVQISKTDLTTGKPLVGAELELQDSNGKIIDRWTTGTKPHEIEKLKAGTYYLIETSTIDGYVLNTEKVKIVVKDTEEIIKAEMKNAPTRVEISKINNVDGKLLAGAKLQVQDKDGNVIKEWVSENKEYIIEGLKYGTYYLVEVSAPEGYELNTEKISFEVNKDKEIVKVEMQNTLLVEVPDTLSARSTLLLCIAMFDIALGIGIITYVKKNKIKE